MVFSVSHKIQIPNIQVLFFKLIYKSCVSVHACKCQSVYLDGWVLILMKGLINGWMDG